MTAAPASIVETQLDAYNARDIDAFMACWADDAQYFAHPATLLANGATEIRERHITRFREPDLFGRLVHRAVLGDTVIDHEVVTRTFADGPGMVEVVAIYEIAAGKIAQAWFILGPAILDRG